MNYREIKQRNKVAIVGYAQHRYKAPFDDDTFDIWSINEVVKTLGVRGTVHWNLHTRQHIETYFAERIPWLAEQKEPTLLLEPMPQLPNAVIFPREEVQAHFEPYRMPWEKEMSLFSSSVGWQFALAIMLGYEEIHMYGVDMACDSEWSYQKPNCMYWIALAQGLGIKVYLPPESDLWFNPWLYGYEDPPQPHDRLMAVVTERMGVAQNQHQQNAQNINNASRENAMLEGSIRELDYLVKQMRKLDRDSGRTIGPANIEDGPIQAIQPSDGEREKQAEPEPAMAEGAANGT